MISFVIIPPICFVYAIYLYLVSTFNLNPHTHKVIKNEIDCLQLGGSKNDVTPGTKHVVEDLTGYNYSPNIHFLNA